MKLDTPSFSVSFFSLTIMQFSRISESDDSYNAGLQLSKGNCLLPTADVFSGEAHSFPFGLNIPVNDLDKETEEMTIRCGLWDKDGEKELILQRGSLKNQNDVNRLKC